ncbi:hypothetical protein P8C59_003496 [Phyllachora maydis]|uniref:Reverse transcriptase Ty1/copia-type domain-containing protein n=1 Tax=Phyllachora maydis TaxID=1825666 RepID=A0AAD9MBH7_9PEZI|nr:hypothetical protein P8C59_003496 [Phyllachora maydis]
MHLRRRSCYIEGRNGPGGASNLADLGQSSRPLLPIRTLLEDKEDGEDYSDVIEVLKQKEPYLGPAVNLATSNLDLPIDIGSKEGFKDTIPSSIVKELSKKAYTILDNRISNFLENPDISNTYSNSDQAVLLMLLCNSLSNSPRAAISWIYIPSKAFNLLVRQYSRPIESKKEDVYNEFYALTFSTYKKGLSAFNAEFNGYFAKLTMAKIDIDPSLILNQQARMLGLLVSSFNIEYLIANILEESRNLAIEVYKAAYVANSSNSTPNSNSNPSKKGKNKKKGKKKASYNVKEQNYSAKSAEQASFILGSYNLAVKEEEEESDSSSNSSSITLEVLSRKAPPTYIKLVLDNVLYLPNIDINIVSGVRYYDLGGCIIKETLYRGDRRYIAILDFKKSGFFLDVKGSSKPILHANCAFLLGLTSYNTTKSIELQRNKIVVEIPSNSMRKEDYRPIIEDAIASEAIEPKKHFKLRNSLAKGTTLEGAPYQSPYKTKEPKPLTGTRDLPYMLRELVIEGNKVVEKAISSPTLKEPNIGQRDYYDLLNLAKLWHVRLGYIGLCLLKKTSSITKGLPNFDKIKEADFHCSSYDRVLKTSTVKFIEDNTVLSQPTNNTALEGELVDLDLDLEGAVSLDPSNLNTEKPISIEIGPSKLEPYESSSNSKLDKPSLDKPINPVIVESTRPTISIRKPELPKAFPQTIEPIFAPKPIEEIEQSDFIGAFLNSALREEIYIEIPKGLLDLAASNKAIYKLVLKYGYNPSTPNIIKLSKALYSLKQSPREWQDKLKILLKSLGYLPLILDLGVFYNAKTCHFIVTYIDNYLFIGPDIGYITDLKKRLNKYLNSTKDYSICFSYNGNTVANLGPELSNSSNTTTKLSRDFYSKEGPRPLTTTSTTIVDSRNGKGSSRTSIINSSLVPIGFSNSDFTGDKATSKSTYGYLYKLAGSPISWKTKRATTIALSTLEAKTDGLTEAIREVQWIIRLFSELHRPIDYPITLYRDNQGSITVANDPALYARTKHTLLKFRYVREQVKAKIVTVIYLNTNDIKTLLLSLNTLKASVKDSVGAIKSISSTLASQTNSSNAVAATTGKTSYSPRFNPFSSTIDLDSPPRPPRKEPYLRLAINLATSNLDPPIDIGSKEGFKDTITSSIVKETSKKAYTILDNSKLSGEKNHNISNTYSDSNQAVLLMLLRNS